MRETATSRPHALAVGASGMLAGACRGLVERGWQVTLVARDRRKLAAAAAGSPHIATVPVDYRDGADFAGALTAAAGERGPVSLALCWIRGTAPDALTAAAAAVTNGGRVIHVLGSASQDPSTLGNAALLAQGRVRYQRVVLGFVMAHGRSRWLTDQEVSDGTLVAVDDPSLDPHAVGQLAPWHARP